MEFQKLLSTKEAAGLLNVSSHLLIKMRFTGGGPAFCKVGARVLYRPEALASWIQASERGSTCDTGPQAA